LENVKSNFSVDFNQRQNFDKSLTILCKFCTYQWSFHISSWSTIFHSNKESGERMVLIFNVYHIHQILGPIPQPLRVSAESQRRVVRRLVTVRRLTVMKPGHPHAVQTHLGLHTAAPASAKHRKPCHSLESKLFQKVQKFDIQFWLQWVRFFLRHDVIIFDEKVRQIEKWKRSERNQKRHTSRS